MFPLGALIAGDPAGAYRRARQDQQQVDLGDYAAQGQQVAGEALQSLIPGMTPMPQASQPQNPLQMLAQRFRALGAPQQPPMQMGVPAPSGGAPPMPYGLSSPMGPAPPMGGPPGAVPGSSPGMPGAAAPSPMPGAGAPPASPGMGQFAAGGPRLSLQQAIEAVGRNPQARGDPRVFFSAISQMTPLIRMEDQASAREMMLAMREHIVNLQQAGMLARTGMQQEGATARTGMQQEGASERVGQQVQSRENIVGQQESARERRLQEQLDAAQKRIETLEKGRSERLEKTETGKGERLEKTEKGKGERLEKTETGKTERFKAKEERLSRESMVRQDRSMQELELKKRALAQRITEQGDRSMLAQWRAVVDAQHKKAVEIIAASPTGMDEAERKKLLAEEDKFYREEIEKMRAPKQQAPADTGGEWKVEKVQ